MPELPDVVIYVEALERKVRGEVLRRVRVKSPFVLRSVAPPVAALEGRRVEEVRRLGKRIALGLDGGSWLVIHLMIAGRLRWREAGKRLGGKNVLAELEFDGGTVVLTEASSKRRASLHVVADEAGLAEHGRGGLEVEGCTLEAFREALLRESHTLKRTLTDPRLFSGIGNAYSDEILHAAELSPVALGRRLSEEEVRRLWDATRTTLAAWTERLRAQVGEGFPEKVTAFRPEMAVHGKYGEPCPRCGDPVQRIRHAENEVNYCVTCQTGGRLLADRSLSRLLKEDWPRSLEELEERRR